jgi:hypothetical protein
MITGELFISTTWAASTSFIPFDIGMRNAQGGVVSGVTNRGYFATTAYVHGVWEYRVFEEGFKDDLRRNKEYDVKSRRYARGVEEMRGLGGSYQGITNAFSPGTIVQTKVRKLKALKASPNRSGVQVSRRLVKGNKLVFRYIGKGELVRP